MADQTERIDPPRPAGVEPDARGSSTTGDVPRQKRVWLYFSGGGLRAALGSLGVVWFLNHEASGRLWPSVTRISSVSGGSVENAALMTDPDIDTHVRAAFRRFTGHGSLGHYLSTLWSTALWLGGAGLVAVVAVSVGGLLELGLWVIVVALVLAMLQNLVTSYTRARLAGIATGSEPDTDNRRLHLFAAADTRSGLPVYFASRHGEGGTYRAVLAHDRRAERTGVEFFDLKKDRSPADLAFASSRWPMLHTPAGISGTRSASRADASADQAFWIEQTEALSGDRAAGRFNLLDGGLTGTLGTRLDPRLFGMDGTGVMGAVGWSLDDGSDAPIVDDNQSEPSVHRVVVDGAKYISSNPLYLLHRVPGVGGVIGIMRAITVSLDSQITLDRDLVDDQPAVWYVPVTGHGRRQPLKYTDDVRLAVIGRGVDRNLGIRALDRLDIMKRAVNHEAVLLVDLDQLKAQLADELDDRDTRPGGHLEQAEKTIELIERLRFMADATSYFRLLRQRGLACSASGVANAFIEARGMRGNHERLVELIDEFTVAVRQRGALDEVLIDPTVGPASVYRWPELLDVHPSAAPSYWVSHRGDRTNPAGGRTIRGNTRAAFAAAHTRGARVFECDVQAVKSDVPGGDDVLVGLHTAFGWHIDGFRLPRAAWRMTQRKLDRVLGDRMPADTIADLLRAFPDVSWNLEAKRARSMRALLRTLDELDAEGALPDRPVIISGGMRKRTLRIARHDTARPLVTAATLGEKTRLFFGRRTPHVGVVQLPARTHRVTGRIARNAIAQRIHVQWFGVSSRRQADRLRRRSDRCGFSTDDHSLIELTI